MTIADTLREARAVTDKEHEKWNKWYAEAVRRDLERQLYKQCDREDALAELEKP